MKKNYCIRSYGHRDGTQLDQLIDLVGKLPQTYLGFLDVENGGLVNLKEDSAEQIVLYCLADHANSILSNYEIQINAIDERLLAIGEYLDRSNKRFYLNLKTGEISDLENILASSIYDFLDRYCETAKFEDYLDYLISSGHVIELENYLKDNFDPCLRANGFPLVEYAIMLLKPDILRVLGKYDFDFSDSLHLLLEGGMVNQQLIEALIDGGADIHSKNNRGETIFDKNSPWLEEIKSLEQKRAEQI